MKPASNLTQLFIISTNSLNLAKLVLIIGLFAILNISCTQESKKAPDVLYQETIDPNAVFSLNRNGHLVNIKWNFDFSTCGRIEILRNTTGVPVYRDIVAILNGKKQTHEDVVPSTKAFWYLLTVSLPEGGTKTIGPIRIAPDDAGSGKYFKYEDIYKFQAERNENSTQITWAVPPENLKHIQIKRNTSQKNINRKEIIRSREPIDKINDPLPDAEADYWYWMEILLENGTFISVGPQKAIFQNK